MKDDKSYPYLQITKEPYPQLLITRKIKKDGSKYFGPYTDSRRLRMILKVLHKVFPIRSCSYFIDDNFIKEKKLTTGHAKILIGLDNPTHVANKIIEKKLSVRQAESLVRVFKMKKGSSKNSRDPNLQSLESSIIEKIGLKVFIKNTVIGAVLWVTLFSVTGYSVGEIEWVKNNYGLIFLGLIVITILPFFFTLVKRIVKIR